MRSLTPTLLLAAMFLVNGCQTTSESTTDTSAPAAKNGSSEQLIPAVVSKSTTTSTPQPAAATPKKPAQPIVVTALLIDFIAKNQFAESTAADFKAADAQIPTGTKVNFVETGKTQNIELEAMGSANFSLTSQAASGPFRTNKGDWKDHPILNSYLFTPQTLSDENHPTLTLSGLDDIPSGAKITLTLWGIGDTPDSDTTFECHYDGSVLDTLTSDYDSAISDTRVQLTFDKIDTANELSIKWGQGGATIAGFSGLSLVATSK